MILRLLMLTTMANGSFLHKASLTNLMYAMDDALHAKTGGSIKDCIWFILDNSKNDSDKPWGPLEDEQMHARYVYSSQPLPLVTSKYHAAIIDFKWDTHYSFTKLSRPFHSRLIRSTIKPYCVVFIIPDPLGWPVNYHEVNLSHTFISHSLHLIYYRQLHQLDLPLFNMWSLMHPTFIVTTQPLKQTHICQ